MARHIPVLQKEVLNCLDPKPNENFIDCTIDGGGHGFGILEKILPAGKLLGIDCDKELIYQLETDLRKTKFKNNLILVCANFANLEKIVEKYNFKEVQGILLDLGMSSWHLEKSGRGFSFLRDEPLDMRYHVSEHIKDYVLDMARFPGPSKRREQVTAGQIINSWLEPEIEKILREYGEERFSKKIAKEIVKERKIRPIKTTLELVETIKRAIPSGSRHKKIHFATRTFQALRIAVNDELNNLGKVLPQMLKILEPGGKIAIISFHSLEDRIVKNFLKENFKRGRLKLLTKKPLGPSREEMELNPRSRSAKLRSAQFLRSG